MLDSGRVFPLPESDISWEPFKIPGHWPRICGLDLGYDHPTAAARLAWDRDSDVVYVTDAYRERGATIATHAKAIKARGDIVVAWPHYGLQHDRTAGKPLAGLYTKVGVNMLPERATFVDGSNSVEAGVLEMYDRMMAETLKAFSNLVEWFDEFRQYHRKDGRLVKERDDLISATRYALMMLRHAKTTDRQVYGRHQTVADHVNYDVFNYTTERAESSRNKEFNRRARAYVHPAGGPR